MTELPDGPPPEVVVLFEKLALEIIGRGLPRYSARAIMHRIRWHFHIDKGYRDFTCNNNWTPQMARRFMARYPEYDNFFEIRASPGTVPLPRAEPWDPLPRYRTRGVDNDA